MRHHCFNKPVKIYLFFLMFWMTSGVRSQSLLLPDSNAIWIFYGYSPNASGPPVFSYYTIYSKGDTSINGRAYHKLYLYLNSNNNCYIGGYRNDSLSNKTYLLPNNDTTEYLFFDFNVVTNDSVKHKTIFGKDKCIVSNCLMGYPSWINANASGSGVYDYAECLNISTSTFTSQTNIITKDNKQRKIFTTNYNYYPSIKLIEGIGLSVWSSHLYSTQIPDYHPYGLGCFYENNNLVFEDTLVTQYNGYFFQPCSQKYTGIHLEAFTNCEVVIYPNPFTGDSIYFKKSNEKVIIKKGTLYDMVGRNYNIELFDKKIVIPTNMPEGIYILRLETDNQDLYYFKIIKK